MAIVRRCYSYNDLMIYSLADMYRTLFLILSWVPLALANDNWENFTNNLATDLVCSAKGQIL